MNEDQQPGDEDRKPVYADYFADPFAWRHHGEWYAVGTGSAEAGGHVAGRVFPVLRSADFVNWKSIGHALEPPDPALGTHFWAPEVAAEAGCFYLYYSVGFEDRRHQLRVAVSESPQGPYRDSGHALLSPADCPFAIDPHPFRDRDGRWYLFYARDFLDTKEGARAGTALMVAPFRTMTELEEPGVTVLRARWDWQRFQRARQMYDASYDWHTLEGPTVCFRGDRYYCFYSGGRWETQDYGVDYATGRSVTGPYEDSGSNDGPRVLRTFPGRLLGPGHNSVVQGPDGADYIVYHAWDPGMTARRMFINRLEWTPDGPRCAGGVPDGA